MRIIRYFLGYVTFEGEGAFGERFLNLLFNNGISVWDVTKHGVLIRGKIRASQYKKIRPYARKTGMRIRIKKKRGVPFFAKKILKRKGIIAGAIVFAAVMMMLTSFIWSVEVSGNEKVDTKTILDIAYSYGIKPSSFKGNINYKKIELEMQQKLPELSWVGISAIGSKVVINVKERVMPPDMVNHDDPCNVVAADDGFITDIAAYDGQAVKKEGDAVMKGELLISGAFEDKKGTVYLKHARGKVIAQTQRTLTAEMPLVYIERNYIGEAKYRRTFSILGITIPLYLSGQLPGNAEVSETVNQLEIFGVKLPAIVTVQEIKRYEETEIDLTEEQVRTMLLEKIAQMETEQFARVTIKSKDEGTLEKKENSYVLTVTYSCEEDIAKEEKIEIN